MSYSVKLTVHKEHVDKVEGILALLNWSAGTQYSVQSGCTITHCVLFEPVSALSVLMPALDTLQKNGISYSFEWKSEKDSDVFGESHFRKDEESEARNEWIGERRKVVSIEDARNTLIQGGELGLMELFEREEEKYDVMEWELIAV